MVADADIAQSGRPWLDRLDQLGAYQAAAAEEAFARSQRARSR